MVAYSSIKYEEAICIAADVADHWNRDKLSVRNATGQWRRQVPPVPGFEFVLAAYASKVRVLGILWLVYAGISLIFGVHRNGFRACVSFARL